jgi:hypothetical protein
MAMLGLFFLYLSASANILLTVDPEEVGISGKQDRFSGSIRLLSVVS